MDHVNKNILSELADYFQYPTDQNLAHRVTEFSATISESNNQVSTELEKFAAEIKSSDFSDLQETYVGTFDLNKNTTPFLGHLVLGENYNRGEFMSRLKDTYGKFGFFDDSDLPDHISIGLRFIGHAGLSEEVVRDFLEYVVKPSLNKLKEDLGAGENPNPYYPLVCATDLLIKNFVRLELTAGEVKS